MKSTSMATLAVIAVIVLAPGGAWAGGYSTVELSSPPSQDMKSGQAWDARFRLLAHGRMPMTRMKPVVRIERPAGGGGRTIRAAETDTPGTYRARVVFPADGLWAIEVREHPEVVGHSFGEVRVGMPSARAGVERSSEAVSSLAALAIALALGLLAGLAAWLIQRRAALPRSAAESG